MSTYRERTHLPCCSPAPWIEFVLRPEWVHFSDILQNLSEFPTPTEFLSPRIELNTEIWQTIAARNIQRNWCSTWERQALRGRIRVVRTVPHTVRRCFESQSNECERPSDAPVCYSNVAYDACRAQGGDITVRDGHYRLLPVTINFEGARLACKDPLPSDGASCRADVVTDLEQLARLLNVLVPNLQCLLPHTVFKSSSGMLSHVQSIAQSLSKVSKSLTSHHAPCGASAVRGSGSKHRPFCITERYFVTARSRDSVLNGLLELVQSKGWVASHNARLALLYLIGKGKSMTLPKIN